MLKFILLIFIFLNTVIYANPISVDEKKSTIEILSSSEIFIDNTKLLTIDDIQKDTIAFKTNEKERLSFGYSPDFNVWIKFTLKNTTNKRVTKILEYANPLTTHISFYDLSNDVVYKDGLFQINQERKTVNPFFNIELESLEKKTYYLKLSSNITAMIVQLKIWDKQTFYNHELKHQSILQLFFGAMLILALYNLFIYLFSKDISYLFYVLYIFGVIIHQLAYTGIFDIYFLSQNNIVSLVNNAVFISLFPVVMLSFFIKYFLRFNRYKKIYIILNMMIPIVIIFSLLFVFYPELNLYRNLLSMILVCYLIFITIYMVLKRNRQAYFILVGWILIGSASLLMYLNSTGIFNIYHYFPYFIEFAFISEALLFSLALADKINRLQYEKDSINKKLIVQKETEKERLKVEVKIKTKELQKALNEQTTLLQELNHRVKNNMQTIISLIRLQADEVEDEDIQGMFVTIQNRISAMSYLHELLYKKSDISYVNTYEYFEVLIDNLQNSFENEIDIFYNVNVNLSVEEAISCGLILNELIINSFKYASDDDNGTIKVELYKEDEIYYFNVSDTGKGYEFPKRKNSFGLVLVSTLVSNHLDGTVHTTSKNGVTNQIIWRKHV